MDLVDFPLHQRNNVSCLEGVRAEICGMRAARWPYARIAEWLLSEKEITISKEAIRQFCAVRGIGEKEARTERPPLPAPPSRDIRAPRIVKRFDFDESKPIMTKRNQSEN